VRPRPRARAADSPAEQEITGDVLLELDANLLKSELGIAAFGKRVRIANAISELKRPPSVSYSDRGPPPIAVPGPGAGAGGSLATPASHAQSFGSNGYSDGGPLSASFGPGNGSGNGTGRPGGHFHRRNVSDVSGSVASSVRWGTNGGESTADPTTVSDGASYVGLGFALSPRVSRAGLARERVLTGA
jgi:hypothetical protein